MTTQYEFFTAEMIRKAYKGKLVEPVKEGAPDDKKTFMQAVDFEIGRLKEKQQKGLRVKSTITKWETKRMDQVRDVFLFSCFTGLAYKEVYILTLNDIVTGNDGGRWIKINRVKTATRRTLPSYPFRKPLWKNTGTTSVGIDIHCNILTALSEQFRF